MEDFKRNDSFASIALGTAYSRDIAGEAAKSLHDTITARMLSLGSIAEQLSGGGAAKALYDAAMTDRLAGSSFAQLGAGLSFSELAKQQLEKSSPAALFAETIAGSSISKQFTDSLSLGDIAKST